MNKVWFLIVGITVVTSCAPSYQKYNRKRYRIEMKKKEKVLTESKLKINYSKSTVINHQSEDAKFINENYTEEEKKDFAKKYFYKEIFFRNDSLITIK
jgi:hypothetical protein